MISIRIEKLTKRFGAVTALDGLDLEIRPGELFFLLGPSGCGKTTLLRTLAGFTFPDEGRVFFQDDDVTRLAPHKRNTGMMFQSYALWPHMTVAENVAFGLEERRVSRDEIRRRVGESLESVRMGAYAARRPAQLSGGQQQRVAVARALAGHPAVLLADEPTGNLDSKNGDAVMDLLQQLHRGGATILMVTHDTRFARHADRVVHLFDGRIVEEQVEEKA